MSQINCKKDKVQAVYDFLILDDDDVSCLIIVGLGGAGKSLAVNAAIAMYDPSEDNDYNIYVWNEGELPGLYRCANPDNGIGGDKWILTRRNSENTNDTLTRGLIEEWDSRCRVVHFERGVES